MSSRNIDKTSNSKTCLLCNKTVVDAVFCKMCNSPYHPKCATRVTVLDNGAYSKCCKPRSPLPASLSDHGISDSSHTSKVIQTTSGENIEQIITKAISKLQVGLNMNFTSLSTTMNELSAKIDTVSIKVDDIKETVNIHSRKIFALEDTLENLNAKSLTNNCMTEIHDRLSRSHNLILFGLIEDNFSKDQSQTDFLNAKIAQILSNFSLPPLLENLKMYRLGAFAQNQKQPRPVKIICNSSENADALHRSFLAAKRNDAHRPLLKNLRLSRDMTKMQLEEIATLKRELESRQLAGEVNARIVYRHGTPTIITNTQRQKPKVNAQGPNIS